MCRALEEIEREKETLDRQDICEILNCGDGVARRVIREIREFCGFSPLPKGKIFVSEYKAYVAYQGQRGGKK